MKMIQKTMLQTQIQIQIHQKLHMVYLQPSWLSLVLSSQHTLAEAPILTARNKSTWVKYMKANLNKTVLTWYDRFNAFANPNSNSEVCVII